MRVQKCILGQPISAVKEQKFVCFKKLFLWDPLQTFNKIWREGERKKENSKNLKLILKGLNGQNFTNIGDADNLKNTV